MPHKPHISDYEPVTRSKPSASPRGEESPLENEFDFRPEELDSLAQATTIFEDDDRPIAGNEVTRSGPLFLSNRNLESHYGVDRVLRAFAIIQKSFPEARLAVAGDGSQRRSLEQLAGELNLRHVEFIGQIEQGKVFTQYDAADIYLNGSEIDNQPLSLLEAFACGLPVVTTNAGGIPDIVTHERTGLLVERGDHEATAREALRLLQDTALAERIMNQAREECRRYSWAAVREQWLELFEGLAPAPEKLKAAGRKQKAENEVVDAVAPK